MARIIIILFAAAVTMGAALAHDRDHDEGDGPGRDGGYTCPPYTVGPNCRPAK